MTLWPGILVGEVAAQVAAPPVDYLHVGLGLNLYQGDLDSNPSHDPVKYLASANVNGIVEAGRSFGDLEVAAQLNFNRLAIELGDVDMANTLAGLFLVGSYDTSLFRRNFLRVFAGGGPMLTVPSYYRFPDTGDPATPESYDDPGTRVIPTATFGVTLQQRIRLGVNVNFTDLIDGVSNGGDRDYVSFVNLGYRFRFNQ